MRDADRYKLLGTYGTPRVRIGRVLSCEARDCDVIVTGYSDARIPWPLGRRPRLAAKALVVFGNLARAVRTESNLAVGYWFGVTPQTVSKWRKGLGVGLTNPGTHRLRSDHQQEPWAKRARKKAVAKAGDPERRRKIAEARRGKPRPPHVIEAMRAGRTGKPHSAATRAKMRAAAAARLARGVVPNGRAWTREEDEVVLTLPTADAARRTGRTVTAVYKRRRKLRRAAGGMSAGPPAG